MAEIKAIETTYKGYKFRSRLEARWAVFFDALEINYEYEAEGYKKPLFVDPKGYEAEIEYCKAIGTPKPKNDEVYWLPDFWLSGIDLLIEIKPITFIEDDNFKDSKRIFAHFAEFLNKDILLISGNVSPSEYVIFWFRAGIGFAESECPYSWGVCSNCLKGLWIVNEGWKATKLKKCDNNCLANINENEKYSLTKTVLSSNKIFLPIADSGLVEIAFNKAKAARFEYGEKG